MLIQRIYRRVSAFVIRTAAGGRFRLLVLYDILRFRISGSLPLLAAYMLDTAAAIK